MLSSHTLLRVKSIFAPSKNKLCKPPIKEVALYLSKSSTSVLAFNFPFNGNANLRGDKFMRSIWKLDLPEPNDPPNIFDQKVDVVIIGAGLSGILTGWFLKEGGVNSIILDASSPGSGQSGHTTAKITAQHGPIYQKLADQFGMEKASEYAKANSDAISLYYDIIKKQQIDCHFQFQPAYLYSTTESKTLEREVEVCNMIGLPAEFTTKTALPFSVMAAALLPNQAQFHPMEFLAALKKQLTVYEHTAVTGVNANEVHTDTATIQAKYIVFASHYPFINVPGFYFMRMHQERSYVVALKDATQLGGMYLGIDSDSLSFRNYEDILLLGGGAHRTGENQEGGRYQMLRQKASQFWPNSHEIAHWSAQDCITLDGVPYIGQFSSLRPNWYIATGYGKWGMTHSMVAAKRISEMILGSTADKDSLFSPSRFTLSASAKQFLEDGIHAVQDLSRQILAPPRDSFAKLEKGHGGIVEHNGNKVGVYKDSSGELFFVSTKCPHLGCQLEWNPDEKSWDCPCHGSRFNYHGHRIDSPAQNDLPYANG